MATVRQLASRITALFKTRRLEKDLDDEVRAHIEMLTEENVRRGISAEEARYQALREFGGVDQAKEVYRDQRGLPMIETLLQDLRYGLRVLGKSPGFSAVAIITLGLGIAVNTTIFSFVSAVLLRKPPVGDPGQLMMIRSRNPGQVWAADRAAVSPPDFLDWKAQSTSFMGFAASNFDELTLSGGSEPERVGGARVSANYFDVLGVAPSLGRTFVTGEDQTGRDHVVLLSEGLWRRRFGGDTRMIGRTVKVNGEDFVLIGIMPSSFQLWSFPAQLWTPLVFTTRQLSAEGRKARSLDVFARLKPGVAERQARAEIEAITARLAAAHPESNKGWGANLMSLQEFIVEDANVLTATIFLMATVGFVLLIACANLANLLLARNSTRQREFTIRAALGAGRGRLARQLLSECLILSLAGGGLGLVCTFWGAAALRAAINWNDFATGMASGIHVDGRVLLFTFAVSVFSAMVFGLLPALRISRPDLNSGLKESSRSATGGRSRHRLQSLLVVGQLAMSLILLVGAGLFAKSFIDELHATLGFNPNSVLTASVSLSGQAYEEPAQQAAFFQNVLRRLENDSQVQSAALASDLPVTFPETAHFVLEGRPAEDPDNRPYVGHFLVSPRYFSTLQAPLLQGRDFTSADNADSQPVVIVSRAFAEKYLPHQNPLGQHMKVGDSESAKWAEIVGVVGDIKEFLGQNEERPHVFEPYIAHPAGTMKIVARTHSDAAAFAASMRAAVWGVDKDQAVNSVRTMDQVLKYSRAGDDLMTEMMSTFAGLALLMAAVGIYGLLAYLVEQRAHEFGIRIALGARGGDVLQLVFRNATTLVLLGVGIGFLISLALPSLFTASFNGFHVRSFWVLVITPCAVILVALAACYLPARRAAKVDPLVALRYE